MDPVGGSWWASARSSLIPTLATTNTLIVTVARFPVLLALVASIIIHPPTAPTEATPIKLPEARIGDPSHNSTTGHQYKVVVVGARMGSGAAGFVAASFVEL